jgi:hypothetical protein
MKGTLKGEVSQYGLASCLAGLESAVWKLTIFVFIDKTGSSKQFKQEVNCTAILPPLVFPETIFLVVCDPSMNELWAT